ncbi:MAG: TatD family hydrolase [Deltaproteobacteria bacterium]|nr:TatD family hydrolase [Candidatus Tharpella sp.]
MKLFDTHCHLTDPPLAKDLDGVLQRAVSSGVEGFIVPGYDLVSSRTACRLASANPSIYAAIGLHPAWLTPASNFSPESFRQLARLRIPVAIGEIGLDYALKDYSVLPQTEVLRAQLELATILSLPVIIHCRRAFEPLFLILREFSGVVGVLHAYGGGPQLAEKFLSLGYYIGFGGGLTRPQARKVRETALMVPADRILLETDAPYIGSHTVAKGKSEPRDVLAVALALAGLRSWELAETAALTMANASRLFNLKERI